MGVRKNCAATLAVSINIPLDNWTISWQNPLYKTRYASAQWRLLLSRTNRLLLIGWSLLHKCLPLIVNSKNKYTLSTPGRCGFLTNSEYRTRILTYPMLSVQVITESTIRECVKFLALTILLSVDQQHASTQ